MNPKRPRFRLLQAVLLPALLLASCGDGTGPVAADGGGEDVPVLVVEVGGGFVTPEMAFRTLPVVAVYSDGRVITPGAQILIYPGPALPSLFVAQLSLDGIAEVIEVARQAGLAVQGREYGSPPIADAPATTVTVRIDGVTYTHHAEALGYGEEGLEEEQRRARAALASFVAAVGDLRSLVGEGELGPEAPFEAERYRLLVRPAAQVDAGVEWSAGEPQPRQAAWEVEGVELVATSCVVVEGGVAREVAAALGAADELTRFVSGAESWSVLARPVLPHEPSCP